MRKKLEKQILKICKENQVLKVKKKLTWNLDSHVGSVDIWLMVKPSNSHFSCVSGGWILND